MDAIQDGRAPRPEAMTGAPACTGGRESPRFAFAAGRAAAEIGGSAASSAKVDRLAPEKPGND